jgi:hypothetical protein
MTDEKAPEPTPAPAQTSAKTVCEGLPAPGSQVDPRMAEPPAPLTTAQLADSKTPWDDLPLDAQVERMRSMFKALDRNLARTTQELNVLVDHQHGPGGQLLVPHRPGGVMRAGSSYPADEKPARPWF